MARFGFEALFRPTVFETVERRAFVPEGFATVDPDAPEVVTPAAAPPDSPVVAVAPVLGLRWSP